MSLPRPSQEVISLGGGGLSATVRAAVDMTGNLPGQRNVIHAAQGVRL
jgi:hypothetical protein